ncbi:MAG: hypothetical protein ACFB10_20075 [Salibacteraceae bacterium]
MKANTLHWLRLLLLYLALIGGLIWLHNPFSEAPENQPQSKVEFIYQQF